MSYSLFYQMFFSIWSCTFFNSCSASWLTIRSLKIGLPSFYSGRWIFFKISQHFSYDSFSSKPTPNSICLFFLALELDDVGSFCFPFFQNFENNHTFSMRMGQGLELELLHFDEKFYFFPNFWTTIVWFSIKNETLQQIHFSLL